MATAPLSAKIRKYAKRGLCNGPRPPYFSKVGGRPRVRIACPGCVDITLCINCAAAASFGFTGQEVTVLRLLCDGLDGVDIECVLNISEETVKRHCTNMFDKSGTYHRTALAMRAVREGWVRVEIKVLAGKA